MINQRMSPEERKHILDAAEHHIRNHSVIVSQVDGSGGSFIGSAICVKVSERLFLATAAHNFAVLKDGGAVVFFSSQKYSRPPLKPIAHNYSQYGDPDTLDMAWIEIDPSSASQSGLNGLPLSSLDPYHSVQNTLCYTIAGFPWERAVFHKKNSLLLLTCEAVMFITIPATPNAGDDALFFEYPEDAISIDGPDVPYPGGMSGGGIWAAPLKDQSPIYVPAFQVVAITTSYFKKSRRIRALRIHQWLRFLLSNHPELEKEIEPYLIPPK